MLKLTSPSYLLLTQLNILSVSLGLNFVSGTPGYGNCDGNGNNGCEATAATPARCGTDCLNCTSLPHVVSASCVNGTCTGFTCTASLCYQKAEKWIGV